MIFKFTNVSKLDCPPKLTSLGKGNINQRRSQMGQYNSGGAAFVQSINLVILNYGKKDVCFLKTAYKKQPLKVSRFYRPEETYLKRLATETHESFL